MLIAAKEIAVGRGAEGSLVLIELDASRSTHESAMREAGTCIQTFARGRPVPIAGADRAFALDPVFVEKTVFVWKAGMVIGGSPKLVERALRADGSQNWPRVLDLEGNQFLKWQNGTSEMSIDGSAARFQDFLRVEEDVGLPTDEAAAKFESQLRERKRQLAASSLPAASFVKAMQVERSGRQVKFIVDHHEPMRDEAYDFGTIMAIVVFEPAEHPIVEEVPQTAKPRGQSPQR
jgi:hypothetical protein